MFAKKKKKKNRHIKQLLLFLKQKFTKVLGPCIGLTLALYVLGYRGMLIIIIIIINYYLLYYYIL